MKDTQSSSSATDNISSTLHQSQVIYMKRIEKENLERVAKLKRIRRNNVITGLSLAGSVLGIYLYSIFSVKQENFLDELDDKTTNGS